MKNPTIKIKSVRIYLLKKKLYERTHKLKTSRVGVYSSGHSRLFHINRTKVNNIILICKQFFNYFRIILFKINLFLYNIILYICKSINFLNYIIMQLIYLNAELDSTKEYELNAITPQGFKVEITYKPESNVGKALLENGHDLVSIFENASEVHNRFQERHATGNEIAFESYFRSDGYIRKINDIEKVVITLQD